MDENSYGLCNVKKRSAFFIKVDFFTGSKEQDYFTGKLRDDRGAEIKETIKFSGKEHKLVSRSEHKR